MEFSGSAKVIKRDINLQTNEQKIYLKIPNEENKIIEVLTGCGKHGEYFFWNSLLDLEKVKIEETVFSQCDRYFYKGCVISFESERDEMDLVAYIAGDIDVKNREINAGFADEGNAIVSQNIKKALQKARELIDNGRKEEQ